MRYHCPYCYASIEHRRELSGELVTCSKCKGAYFEPSDPLPGVLPQKVPPIEDDHDSETEEPVFEAVEVDEPQGKPLSQCEPIDMVGEVTRRGKHALMITWPPGNTYDANMAFSDQLTRDQANDVILAVAVHLIKNKWPDVYPLVANRVKK